MRVPPFERFAKFTQAVAFIVVGAIIGAMAYHSVYVMNFNALINTNRGLEDRLVDYEERIQKLNQFKDQHTVIKSISATLLDNREKKEEHDAMGELTKSELKRRIKKELSVFIGTSIYKIDYNAEMARLLLDGKVYTDVNGKDYTVEIKTMLIVDNILQVWFKASIYTRPLG
ncbi:hypothetical protein Back11_28340 [Paenibacillus baekrokdamisoli]|uniref:Sporulation membrane protein YtrI C-terminal domain-containing protein n=1 Tax=Paenibacillus baekrokdamisoli TaxID=1712516 RepID=A0A3G9JEV4_9BACL|nr:hypothetical protein [Paenibacillus baekrokdamisoli]MBB3071072.1 hypothetical protein [Paenibacillus baekrokdamisoli]BBH21489.1 hypothetical protein Back11_28340 [Paenibacillus baekrokdamisoli]